MKNNYIPGKTYKVEKPDNSEIEFTVIGPDTNNPMEIDVSVNGESKKLFKDVLAGGYLNIFSE
jgi:hypothetical protein